MIRDRTTLKTYFETGDIPIESNFIDLIDSMAVLSGENTSVGDWHFSGSVSADDIQFTNTTVVGAVTSTGMFMTLTVNGSSLALPLYIY